MTEFGDRRLPVRFWRKAAVDSVTDCWTWRAAKSTSGYGKFALRQNQPGYAHRIAYEALVGTIPEGLVIDHLCRNKLCVNPSHLEAVPQRINVIRGESLWGANAVKTHCDSGHQFTPENTYIRPGGRKRDCKECKRAAVRRYQQRLAASRQTDRAA
ncbi:HNH endonuclease signature motif containing protein [Nocardia asiatica]